MAQGEIDYNIVFPDAVTSGEPPFIVMRVHACWELREHGDITVAAERGTVLSAGSSEPGARPVPSGCGLCRLAAWRSVVFAERHWQKTKEPVVILLGWAGCKDKHLSKYSSIYNEQVTVKPWVQNRPAASHQSDPGLSLHLVQADPVLDIRGHWEGPYLGGSMEMAGI